MTDQPRANAIAALQALRAWNGPSIPTDLAVLIIRAEEACLAALAPADQTADLRAWLDDPLRDYLDERDRAYLATLAASTTEDARPMDCGHSPSSDVHRAASTTEDKR